MTPIMGPTPHEEATPQDQMEGAGVQAHQQIGPGGGPLELDPLQGAGTGSPAGGLTEENPSK
jgi:hypothetical protein